MIMEWCMGIVKYEISDIRLEHIVFMNKNLESIKLIDFGISNSLK